MDWSYADIPVAKGCKVKLIGEKKMLHRVEAPKRLDNEPLYHEPLHPDLGTYSIMDQHKPPIALLDPYAKFHKDARINDWLSSFHCIDHEEEKPNVQLALMILRYCRFNEEEQQNGHADLN